MYWFKVFMIWLYYAILGYLRTHYADQAGLELIVIFLPLSLPLPSPLKCWDYKHEPTQPAEYAIFRQCIQNSLSINWYTSWNWRKWAKYKWKPLYKNFVCKTYMLQDSNDKLCSQKYGLNKLYGQNTININSVWDIL